MSKSNEEDAQNFLKLGNASGGDSLYAHLSKVILKVITERPVDANASFEEFSVAVRTESQKQEEEKVKKLPEGDENYSASTEHQLAWAEKQTELMKPPAADAEPDPPEAVFPNLMNEAVTFEWAGISFGAETTYMLYLSLKSLAKMADTKVRFWGKILAMQGDYYVAEIRTRADDPDLDEVDKTQVEADDGPNTYTYYVTREPGDASSWTKLPHVTPKQIVIARNLKRFFTGDLNAPVMTFPPLPSFTKAAMYHDDKPYHFCGKFAHNTEAHLLRAQIAQITSECVLSLAGYFKEPEDMDPLKPNWIEEEDDEDRIKERGEYVHEQLLDLDSRLWVHAELGIGSSGRCQPMPNEEEGEDPMPSDDDKRVIDGRLGSVSDDRFPPPDQGKPLWLARSVPSGSGKSKNSMVLVRSLKWPGAVAIASAKKKPLNLYVGFGFPKDTSVPKPYAPPMPRAVKQECAEPLNEEEDVIVEPVEEEEES